MLNEQLAAFATKHRVVQVAIDSGDVWVEALVMQGGEVNQIEVVSVDVTTGKSDWHMVRGPALALIEREFTSQMV